MEKALRKVEISDEMVERAGKIVDHIRGITRGDVFQMLKAALSPPPAEPVIPVTQAMLGAGMLVWAQRHEVKYSRDEQVIGDIYRAMRALEPKVELTCPTCSGPAIEKDWLNKLYHVNWVVRDPYGNPMPSMQFFCSRCRSTNILQRDCSQGRVTYARVGSLGVWDDSRSGMERRRWNGANPQGHFRRATDRRKGVCA